MADSYNEASPIFHHDVPGDARGGLPLLYRGITTPGQRGWGAAGPGFSESFVVPPGGGKGGRTPATYHAFTTAVGGILSRRPADKPRPQSVPGRIPDPSPAQLRAASGLDSTPSFRPTGLTAPPTSLRSRLRLPRFAHGTPEGRQGRARDGRWRCGWRCRRTLLPQART